MVSLSFNRWGLGARRGLALWPVLRVGGWLFAVHRLWRWTPEADRFEPDPFTGEDREGWSVVWLAFEVSHVRKEQPHD